MSLTKYLLVAPVLAGLACGSRANHDDSPGLNPVVAAGPIVEIVKEGPANKEPAAPTERTEGSFHYTDDEAGKLLAKMLTSSASVWLEPAMKGPSERALPAGIASPEWPAETIKLAPARCPIPKSGVVRPASPAERVPLELAQLSIDRPDRIELPVGALAKWPALDGKEPAPLAILARPSVDRASLEDPTTEFTIASTVRTNLPLRSKQAPFVKVNLPDPFENVAAARAKIVVPDDPAKALGNPPPPKP